MPALLARAPTRLDFGGGWTDVPPYPERDGGFVCNVAIARYATVRLHPLAHDTPAREASGEQALAQAALRMAALGDVVASVENDFPLGAGLGGSSAAGVAMMGAIEAWRARASGRASRDVPRDRAALAESSRALEVEELHIAGGRQDHYAAAFGGALALSFDAATHLRRLPLSRPLVRELESRCIVAYTGQSRISGDTITAVRDAYVAGDAGVSRALSRMRALAQAMAGALESGDLDALGMLVGEHWEHQRSLHPAITTPRIDRLLEVSMQAGAIGGKALGASGGGCVLLVAARGLEAPVRRAAEELATPLSFSIDQQGLTWWTDDVSPTPSTDSNPPTP